ncbi:MAG: rubrerythrin family protein [Clostridia bacterium]|nr:rubrerythrin family protein [Clostridia bacterium]
MGFKGVEDVIKWRCSVCGYTFEGKEGEAPPEKCPSCQSVCSFIDATCYIPDCGGGSTGE